ncbi:hypothetical protein BJ322DRAFT_1019753 [Thelephora terrestris]|uniref:Uncharacterized protein n=1 Tax=Thelephora terrestris TaxID=56493 RepID=A0A9P6HJ83_9AGAM|nr:hypothetical protein BJ322DRAFT_1019753 [Thelephora terrestris]
MSAASHLLASYSESQVKEHNVPTAENEGSRGGKQSGKRQPTPQDLETDREEVTPDSHSLEDVLAPVTARMSKDRPISASISPESHSQTKNPPSGSTWCGFTTCTTSRKPTLETPSPDIARGCVKVEPIPNRCSKSVKVEKNLVNLAIIDEGTSSGDEIQAPAEVSLSLLSEDECADPRAPLALDMEVLIASAKVKYTKEPSFQFFERVREVVALDDCTSQDDNDDNLVD